VNNRGFLPCQDLPTALSTWDLTLTIPKAERPLWPYCTGDTQGSITNNGNSNLWKFSTRRSLPISAFALAIGSWSPVSLGPGMRLAGPGPLNDQHVDTLRNFLPKAVAAAGKLVGSRYPNPRTDLLVVHRSFSGLGLSSPSLIFLSPSLLAGDPALLIKLAHEIGHAWFGLHILSLDWAETWLTEGFATFLEDLIFAEAVGEDKRVVGIRAMARLLQLEEEVAATSNEEQVMVAPSSLTGVRRGLDPRAGLGQIHYTKGFFLLHFLMEQCGGEQAFLELVATYVKTYAGQPVTGAAFIELFFSTFPHLRGEVEQVVDRWLREPGLQSQFNELHLVKKARNSSLYREVVDHVAEVKHLNAKKKIKSCELDLLHDPLTNTAQISLLLTMLLQMLSIKHPILKLVKARYQQKFACNPELGHTWCELVVRHRLRGDYASVSQLLVEHQAMGVFLYAEMAMAKNLQLNELAKVTFSKVEKEMDEEARKVVVSYLNI